MRLVAKVALGLAGVAVWAWAVSAQPPGGGGGMMMRGNMGMLVMNKSVQQELKLSDEQVEKVEKIVKEMREKGRAQFQKLGDLNEEERRQKMQTAMREGRERLTKALDGVLKDDQMKRLKQISWQQRGAEAFNDPEVQKALKLTSEQKDKLKTIREDAMKEGGEIFRNAGDDREGVRGKLETLHKDTTEKAMAVLTEDQKARWKELVGEPFEVKMEPRRRDG